MGQLQFDFMQESEYKSSTIEDEIWKIHKATASKLISNYLYLEKLRLTRYGKQNIDYKARASYIVPIEYANYLNDNHSLNVSVKPTVNVSTLMKACSKDVEHIYLVTTGNYINSLQFVITDNELAKLDIL